MQAFVLAAILEGVGGVCKLYTLLSLCDPLPLSEDEMTGVVGVGPRVT